MTRGSSVSKDTMARKSFKNFTEVKPEWRVWLELWAIRWEEGSKRLERPCPTLGLGVLP